MTKKISLDVATEYTNRGWKVVPVQYRGKGCFQSEWQNLRLETGDLPQHFNSSPQNIGVLLGEPSGGLVDIDLDAPEAVALAADFLPPTNAKFGRPSKADSHWLYKCVPPGTTSKFADIGDINAKHAAAEKKLMLVEYRSTGVQTVFPGSVHEEGEFIDWSEHGEPAPIDGDVLLVCVKKLAAAAILARHWPVEGARQIAALALGGGLARLGWEIEDVKHFLEAVLSVAVDDEAEKRVASVEYTMKKLATDEPATGWPSLANLVGQDVVGKAREWLGVTWNALGSLPNATKSISPMPPELIPEPLRSWIEDVCAHACIPLELMAVPAMVALSSVVGRTVGISPRCYDDWIVVPNLWGAVIARSGFMKSFAQGEALKPLRRLANVAREQVQEEEVNVSAKRDRIEAEIAAIQSGIKAAAKTHSESISDIETQLAEKKKELISLKQTHRRYMTSDATVEKIGEILVENPRGLLQARDELAGWLNSMDKQGRDGDREFYLESWNGDGEFWCDRIGRGTLYIPALTLSIIGGIQPGKLDSYIAECIEGGMGDDGLLQRIQLAVWVENLGDWKKPESWPNTAAKNRAFKIFEFLDNIEPSNAVTDGSGGSIPAFHFTPDAQELFDRWQAELEKLLRSQKLADFPSFESHLAKYRSLMPSLALLFHLLDVASKSISISGGKSTNRPSATFGTDIMGHSGEKLPDEVPLEATELAIAWCKWLRQHAEKTYSSELNPGVEGAHTIVAKIKNGTIKDGQTVRDIYQHHWRGLKTYPQVLKAVLVLIEANWVHIEEQKTGGRPTEIIRLHPELIADQTGKN